MIKGIGFGKLLKQLFSIGLISCFILLGSSFASAGRVQVIGLESSPSFVDSNYDLTFLKGGGLLSSYLGQGKGILAIDNNALFWWTPNGQPYFYDPAFQGFFGQYWSCDELTGLDSVPTNCSSSSMDGDYVDLFKAFFNKVVAGDYAFYDFTSYNNSSPNGYSRGHTINVCWSSHEIGKSLCFRYSDCVISQGTSCNNRNYGSLTGSQNYSGLTFSNIPYFSIGFAPGQNGYGGVYEGDSSGPIQGGIDSTLTGGTVFTECTVGTAKSIAESKGLNQFVCYAGTDINNTGLQVVTPGQGSSVFDIFQLFNNGKNFSDWFTYRQGIYNNRYTYSDSVWSGYSYIYNYFNIINQYGLGLSSKDIQDYCRIIINDLPLDNKWTGNSAWCPFNPGGGAGGGGGGSRGSDGFTSGDYVIGVNWGVTGQSNKDAKTFIQDFFNKAKSVIPTEYDSVNTPALSMYIVTFLCAIILFRFMRK